jgi:lysyl-tRNA synthetase class 2
LIALYTYRRQFYATGDRRSRWRALWVLAGLVVADLALGLIAIPVIGGLRGTYSPGQRVYSVVANLAGFSGPVRFSTELRNDHFGFVMGGLGLFLRVAPLREHCVPPRRCVAAARGWGAHRAARSRENDSLSYFALRATKASSGPRRV